MEQTTAFVSRVKGNWDSGLAQIWFGYGSDLALICQIRIRSCSEHAATWTVVVHDHLAKGCVFVCESMCSEFQLQLQPCCWHHLKGAGHTTIPLLM